MYLFYLFDENPPCSVFNSDDRVSLTVASEGPFDVGKLCNEIRNHQYYERYDNETVSWLENHKSCKVLASSDAFVAVDSIKIGKIPILMPMMFLSMKHLSAQS